MGVISDHFGHPDLVRDCFWVLFRLTGDPGSLESFYSDTTVKVLCDVMEFGEIENQELAASLLLKFVDTCPPLGQNLVEEGLLVSLLPLVNNVATDRRRNVSLFFFWGFSVVLFLAFEFVCLFVCLFFM